MKCKLCRSENIHIIYNGQIRNGGLGKYTDNKVNIFQCDNCNVIWHENQFSDMEKYYESKEYRNSLEGSSEEEQFYLLHDKETLNKFQYTGTDIFRDKIVADIGCGCGAFLDFLKGVAKTIIAVEPSETYRNVMEKKGFYTYSYADEAKEFYAGKVDVITSFDVIEHVERPDSFMNDIYELLREGGKAIIGTPTDAPVMRTLLGEIYEKKVLFSTQHLWIFSNKNLKILAKDAGFLNIDIKYFQRYGIGNLFGWIRDKEPKGDIQNEFITHTFDSVWKSQCDDYGTSDYIILYLTK